MRKTGDPIYVPYDELYYLLSMELIGEEVRGQDYGIQDLYGKQLRNFPIGSGNFIGLDEDIPAFLRAHVSPMAYGNRWAAVGEEDIEGHIRGPDDPAILADISPCGPASLLGKVALEVARRVEEELTWDRWAKERAWAPMEEPP